jgi:hypothetical protein
MHEESQREILGMPVWPVLRANLWHATSVEASAGIIGEGMIRFGNEGVGYTNGFCRMNGGISLFDFSNSLEDIAPHWPPPCRERAGSSPALLLLGRRREAHQSGHPEASAATTSNPRSVSVKPLTHRAQVKRTAPAVDCAALARRP